MNNIVLKGTKYKYKYKYKDNNTVLKGMIYIFFLLKNYVGRVFSPFVRTLISKVVFLQIAPRQSWHANQPSNKTFLCCLISLTWKEITFSSFFLHLRILHSRKLWIFNVCIKCCEEMTEQIFDWANFVSLASQQIQSNTNSRWQDVGWA